MDCKFLEPFHPSPYGTAYQRERVFGEKCGSIVTGNLNDSTAEIKGASELLAALAG